MGVIQTLRNKGGKISIIVIGLALFMFLVQDALSGRNSIFRPGGDDNYVGSVDGDKIEYKDFEIKAKQAEDLYVERNPQATVDENLKEGF